MDILNKITGKVLKNCEEAQILFAKELVQGAKIADSECLYQLAAAVRTRHPVMEKIGLIVDDDDYLDFLTEAVLLGNDKARLELALLMYVAGGIPWEGERRPETDEEWCDELIEAVDEDGSEASGMAAAFRAWSRLYGPEAKKLAKFGPGRGYDLRDYALSCEGAEHFAGFIDCGIQTKEAFAQALWGLKNDSWPEFSIYKEENK